MPCGGGEWPSEPITRKGIDMPPIVIIAISMILFYFVISRAVAAGMGRAIRSALSDPAIRLEILNIREDVK